MHKLNTNERNMFARTEQNDMERVVIAKLLAFKQTLTTGRRLSSDLYHRFLLDVLKDVLDEAINAIPVVFPLDEDQRTVYDYHLYQQYVLFYLKNSDEVVPETIQKLFAENDRTLPNSNGIVLQENQLYSIQFDEQRKVTDILLIDNSSDSQAYADLIFSIKSVTRSRGNFSEINITADATQQALIASILSIPNVKHPRSDELLVVINLIQTIEKSIKSNLKNYRDCKRMALEQGLIFTILGGGGLLLQNGVHLLLLYAAGKAVTIAKITMLAYICGGFLGCILAITVGMALYFYINERQYDMQLTKLRGLVNQSKTYNWEKEITSAMFEQFDRVKETSSGQVGTKLIGDAISRKVGHIEMNYPSMSVFFSHHAQEFHDLAPVLRNALL